MKLRDATMTMDTSLDDHINGASHTFLFVSSFLGRHMNKLISKHFTFLQFLSWQSEIVSEDATLTQCILLLSVLDTLQN